ncbi:LPS export ABC transporter permease LptG [Candidatus Providencia siddallii]|uniref:Lipopolysaccharide export system permease protein LptG n=1 Tax=Candidatus Providencia siddallii TaxID=1715285 RepID=A0ABM9NPZ9_9GAMM
MIFSILDKYIGRIVLFSILTMLFLLVSISSIIKFVEQFRKVGEGDYIVFTAVVFTLLTIPKDIIFFLPMASMLGTLNGLGSLASNSELVVMQASGFTKLKIVLSTFKIAIPLIIVIMFIGEWISPVSEQLARKYRAEKISKNSLIVTDEGIWIKDGCNFVHIQHIKNSISIENISIYFFNKQHQLQSLLFASNGIYDENRNLWLLSNINKSIITDEKKIINLKYVFFDWNTTLTPEKLNIIKLNIDSLSIRGIYKYILYLKENKQNSVMYEITMWKKILIPFSTSVMILMSISFIFGQLKVISAGIRIILGILCGFLFYIFNQLITKWGLFYSISPIIAVLIPSMFFLLLAIFFYRKNIFK